jgi:hypothetical protein
MTRETIIVDANEDFDSLLTRIRQVASKDIFLVVPAKFRALGSRDIINDPKYCQDSLDNFNTLRKITNRENIQLAIIAENGFVLSHSRFLHFEVYPEVWDGNNDSLGSIIARLEADRESRDRLHQKALAVAQNQWSTNPEEAITRIRFTTPLKLRNPVTITLQDHVELSLDCFMCLKMRRTVFIFADENKSFCTPSYYTRHSYPARILENSVIAGKEVTEIIYTIEYEYRPFIDKRYFQQELALEHAKSNQIPAWGRISFKLSCPNCAETWETGTQSNVIMTRSQVCKCGFMYWEEGQQVTFLEKID